MEPTEYKLRASFSHGQSQVVVEEEVIGSERDDWFYAYERLTKALESAGSTRTLPPTVSAAVHLYDGLLWIYLGELELRTTTRATHSSDTALCRQLAATVEQIERGANGPRTAV